MDERPRILVVEDDVPLAAMLGELLREEGYDVETAHNGQRALHLGLTHKFDALLLDRGLPAIEGLDVLARLRETAAGADELARATGLEAGLVAAALVELELAGLAAEGDGVYRAAG